MDIEPGNFAAPHMGRLLRNRRMYIGITAAEIAEADGQWTTADVLLVENAATTDAADYGRFKQAMEKVRSGKGLTGRV